MLLATVPGITKISPPEDAEYGEWWHYTGRSALRLAEEAFGAGNVEVETYGNVLTAAGFLYGLAAPDLTPGGARGPRPALRGDRRRPGREARVALETATCLASAERAQRRDRDGSGVARPAGRAGTCGEPDSVSVLDEIDRPPRDAGDHRRPQRAGRGGHAEEVGHAAEHVVAAS